MTAAERGKVFIHAVVCYVKGILQRSMCTEDHLQRANFLLLGVATWLFVRSWKEATRELPGAQAAPGG